MKFKFYLLLLFASFLAIHAENEADENPFSRYMEEAHPSPLEKLPNLPFLLGEQSSLPFFLNVQTTIDAVYDASSMENESSIAVNPTNPNNIIASAVDYRDNSSTWVYVSDDGGKTFRSINLGKTHTSWASSNDPSVAFSSDGTAYLVYGSFPQGGVNTQGQNGVFISISKDGGKNWQKHIPVIEHTTIQTADSAFEDKYYITVDNSPASPYFHDLYIPWKRVTAKDSATQIVISKSTDGGLTWKTPVGVSNRLSGSSEDTTFGQSFPYCVTGPAGEVYLFWNNGIVHGVGFSRSTDGGATWTPQRFVANYPIFGKTIKIGSSYNHSVKGLVRAESYPSAACDITNGAHRGTLYLTYAGGNYPNVYFKKSTDGGDTWTDPKFVHSDTTNDQFWQWTAIDPTSGNLAVMYFDSRDDPQNMLVNCYVSFSSDGGDSWIDRRAGDISGDLRLNPFTGQSFAGDYSGCAFYNGIIYPSWVDMRNAVHNLNNSDVFTAIIDISAPKPPYNFHTSAIAEQLGNVVVHWKADAETSFGTALNPDDLEYVLERDGVLLGNFKFGDSTFTDTGLTPFKTYSYSIFAKNHEKFSKTVYTTGIPGGSSKPLPPQISIVDSTQSSQFVLSIKLPSKRADSVTAISNLSSFTIYNNNIEIYKGNSLENTDTNQVKQITLNLPHDGFYRLSAKVSENFTNYSITTSSDTTNQITVYAGLPKIQVINDLSNPDLPFLLSQNWKIRNNIYASSPSSIGNSDESGYKTLQFDTLMLDPIDITPNGDGLLIKFNNACFVRPEDSAFVEYSFDNSGEWSMLKNYNQNDFTPWKSAVLSNDAFRQEELKLPLNSNPHKSIYIRFRFASNLILNSKGWYLDDIDIKKSVFSVEDQETENKIMIYPNPAANFINLKFMGFRSENAEILITNTIGEKLITAKAAEDCSADISNLAEGMYYVWMVENANLKPIGKFIKSE